MYRGYVTPARARIVFWRFVDTHAWWATNTAHSSQFDIQSILRKVEGTDIKYEGIIMSDMVQVLVRLRPDVAEALKLCKERTRMSQSGIIENALREYLEKRGYGVQTTE